MQRTETTHTDARADAFIKDGISASRYDGAGAPPAAKDFPEQGVTATAGRDSGVNVSSILLAFQDGAEGWTFDNFSNVFKALTDKDMFGFNLSEMILRSFLLWCMSNLICFPISIITTYVLFKKIKGHYVFRLLFLIPSLVGGVVWVTLIRYLVAYDGPVMVLLGKLFSFPELAERNGLFGDVATAFPTVLAVTFLTHIVGSNAVLTGAFSRIPAEIFESSRLDGTSFWREFISISVPCIWPTIATLLTFAFCSVLIADNNVYLYSLGTGEPGMATVGFYFTYMTQRISASGGRLAYNYPAAVGLFLTILSVPIALGARKALEKAVEPVEY